MNFFYITFALFLLMDAPGNIPLYISILKGINSKRQRYIIMREMIIAFLVIVLFAYTGQELLAFLHIRDYTIQLAGGIILFLMSLKMIFPANLAQQTPNDDKKEPEEPFIVPLAIPLIAGPVVLATIMLYARQYSTLFVIGASAIAWAITAIILVLAPYISEKIGKRGIVATERLMGLILVLMSVDMFCEGIRMFVASLE